MSTPQEPAPPPVGPVGDPNPKGISFASGLQVSRALGTFTFTVREDFAVNPNPCRVPRSAFAIENAIAVTPSATKLR